MKLRSPILIRLAAFVAWVVIRAWFATVRIRFYFADGIVHPFNHRRQRYLYALWHEDILFAACQKIVIRVLISDHADGELVARIARHLGRGSIRGSTTRGGIKALMQAARIAREHLGVTPDGPRGPRRHVQPGVAYLASLTGLPVSVYAAAYTKCWRAKSWDRFAVPMPFSQICCVFAPELHVPRGLGRSELESYRQQIEERLLWCSAEAEHWAASGGKARRSAGVRTGDAKRRAA